MASTTQSIPQLLQGSVADLGTLARQYLQLTNLKLRGSAQAVAVGGGTLAAAASLVAVGAGELVLALAICIVEGAVGPAARIAALAGALTLVLAWLATLAAKRLLKRVDLSLHVPEDANRATPRGFAKEERSWEMTN